MKSGFSSLVWVRHDLRIRDNPALSFASRIPGQTVALYIHEKETISSISSKWLQNSLCQFANELGEYGIPLLIGSGKPEEELQNLIQKYNIQHVSWNGSYEPKQRLIDDKVLSTLTYHQIKIHVFPGNYLFDLQTLRTKQNTIFQVFTPFYKTAAPLLEDIQEEPLPQKQKYECTETYPNKLKYWVPGEASAWKLTQTFLKNDLPTYATRRDLLNVCGTSRLSPHLHFGEISVRSLVKELSSIHFEKEPFLRQLIWREFATYLLLHFPNTVHSPLRAKFTAFPWRYNASELKSWKYGQTGIPIVDAAMREMLETGWMHNRGRMIVASYLTKHLLHSWTLGSEWFMEKLYDADLANNTFGWQWVAGCGADAAPFFRIFNPVLQGKKYDADGTYVRRYVPEISSLPNCLIHAPWEASPSLLKESGIQLGVTYPYPLITPEEGRKRALMAFQVM